MTLEEEIRAYQQEIHSLAEKVGVASLQAYQANGGSGPAEPVFVVDLDTSREDGYSNRFFDMMFGLQEIFARPVDMWELHMFEREGERARVTPISMELKHAA